MKSSKKLCKSGQVRDRSTKRCRKKKSVGRKKSSKKSRAPCKSGQVRDQSTKRCRKRSATRKSRVPCKSGQVRDQSTKRCRNKRSAASKKRKSATRKSRAPCKSGQVRDKSTKRCRKTKKRYGNAYSPDSRGITKNRKDDKYAKLYAAAAKREVKRHEEWSDERDGNSYAESYAAHTYR